MAKTMTIKDKKGVAEDLFLNTDKTQKEIATIVKVTEKTLGKWKDEGEWELLRQAQTVTAKNIIHNLYKKSYEESLKDDPSADKMIKYAGAIEKLSNRKVTISQIINVFKDFTTYAFGENPEVAKSINELMRGYVDTKINEG